MPNPTGPSGGPVLAVDPGTVRVGLAVSDPGRTIAFPLEVVPAKAALARIRALVAERGIAVIVVGLPLTLRGTIGPEGERVLRFVEKLKKKLKGVPVETLDERLSSSEADRYLSDSAPREVRDAVAASLILERHLARGR